MQVRRSLARRAVAVALWPAALTPAGAHGAADGAAEIPSAPPPGKHCTGRSDRRWFGEQTVFVQSQPAGAELEAKVGACWPFITGQGELFDYTHVLLGADVQATAGYVQAGPYVELMPLSVLGFRAELHWVDYYPAGLSGVGYHRLPSYAAAFRQSDLPAAGAAHATGYNGVLAAWLQIEIGLSGPISVFAWDEAALEHWSLGDGPYYYNARWDLVLASSDELVRNDAFAGVNAALTPELKLGAGPVSLLRRVPAAHYTALELGGALNLSWQPRLGALRSLDGLLGGGKFVAHSFRRGVFLVLSLAARWDLGAL
jgi:hypothetical protein